MNYNRKAYERTYYAKEEATVAAPKDETPEVIGIYFIFEKVIKYYKYSKSFKNKVKYEATYRTTRIIKAKKFRTLLLLTPE